MHRHRKHQLYILDQGITSEFSPPAKPDVLILGGQVFPSHVMRERAVTSTSEVKRALNGIQNAPAS
jgi:hypothetical protein